MEDNDFISVPPGYCIARFDKNCKCDDCRRVRSSVVCDKCNGKGRLKKEARHGQRA